MTTNTPGGLQSSAVDYDPFAGEAIARVVPATGPQREIWLADRQGRDASLAFNESVTIRLRGTLDADALARAFGDLVRRHDALRGTLSEDGMQFVVLADAGLAWASHDLRGEPDGPEAALARARARVVVEPFDLVRGPLVRAELHRLAEREHALLITAHHIVCDGWSFGVLIPDLAALYAWRTGAGTEPPAPDSFAEYADRESRMAEEPSRRDSEAFWVRCFADGVPVLDLPADRPRPPVRELSSRREDRVLPPDLVASVRKFAGRGGTTLFSALAAAFASLIGVRMV